MQQTETSAATQVPKPDPPFKILIKFAANPQTINVEVDFQKDTIQKIISTIEDRMGIPADY